MDGMYVQKNIYVSDGNTPARVSRTEDGKKEKKK